MCWSRLITLYCRKWDKLLDHFLSADMGREKRHQSLAGFVANNLKFAW